MLLIGGNRISPRFPCPVLLFFFLHVFLVAFISKSFWSDELLMWGHLCFSRNCLLSPAIPPEFFKPSIRPEIQTKLVLSNFRVKLDSTLKR